MHLNDFLIEGLLLGALLGLFLTKLFEYLKFRRKIKDIDGTVDRIGYKNRQKLIAEFTKLRKDYSDMSLLVFADKYEWSKEILTCLPKLYFDPQSKGSKSFLIWKEVLDIAPVEKGSIKILNKYCNDEILSVTVASKEFEIISKIAARIERVRIHSPYKNYISFLGAVNQVVNDLELETKALNKPELSHKFSIKRSQFLKEELDIDTFQPKKQ